MGLDNHWRLLILIYAKYVVFFQFSGERRVMYEALLDLDRYLFLLINQGSKNPFFDWLMPIISEWKFFWLPLILILVFILLRGGPRSRWAFVLLILVFAASDSITTYVLKPFFQRPRPFTTLEYMHVYKGHWTTHVSWFNHKTMSFPSTHAVNITAAATVLVYFFRRWWPLAAGLALPVFYSRVYLGLHYPADVLGGILVGMGCAGIFLSLQSLLVRLYPGRFSWLVPEAGP